MVDYVIGLDFGTHQSKICIQNLTANPHTIHFVEFLKNSGETSLTLPSVVQINNDDTLSYGFVENDKLKPAQITEYDVMKPEPVFNEPEPKLSRPVKPENKYNLIPQQQTPDRKNYKNKKDFLKAKKEYNRKLKYWKLEDEKFKNKAKQEYRRLLIKWNIECDDAQRSFNKSKEKWELEKKRFEETYKAWRLNPIDKKKIAKYNRYHYFKMPNFCNSYIQKYNNDYLIDSFKISVLYLTNLLFLIETKVNKKYSIQMGVPTNTNSKQNDSRLIGQKMLVYAFELKLRYAVWKKFLDTKASKLIEDLNQINIIDDNDINDLADNKYFIGIIPEAYAGLISLTSKNKISNGIYFSVDIGGGTTDVSVFTISEDKMPIIHGGYSFDKGLNNIMEIYLSNKFVDTVPTLQKINSLHQEIEYYQLNIIDKQSKTEYREELSKILFRIYSDIIDHAFKKHCIKNTTKIRKKLNDAIKYQPVVYSGGGAFYNEIKPQSIGFFNESKIIDISVIGYRHTLLNNNSEVKKLFPILANSYGLSTPYWGDDEIKPFYELDVWVKLKEIDAEEKNSYERYDCSDD